MKRHLALVLLMAASLAGCAQSVGRENAPATLESGMPREVMDYVYERQSCERWLGEEPFDAASQDLIKQNIKTYCTGTDKRLNHLRQKYVGNSQVMELLMGFATKIER